MLVAAMLHRGMDHIAGLGRRHVECADGRVR
jgi:hypothetical protein